MSRALKAALDAVGAMSDREVLEARYDAMPPEVVLQLRRQMDNKPMARRLLLIKEMSFCRRQFSIARRMLRRPGHYHSDVLESAYFDCGAFARRYRAASHEFHEVQT